MSAFVVGKRHIDTIVTAATQGPMETNGGIARGVTWYGVNDPDTHETLRHDDADRIGLELWSENVRSVAYRYPQDTGNGDRPGPIDLTDDDVRTYTATVVPRLPALAIIKAIHCLEYQSCEHPGWQESWSRRFLENMKDSLVGAIPGYNEAEWEVTHA